MGGQFYLHNMQIQLDCELNKSWMHNWLTMATIAL